MSSPSSGLVASTVPTSVPAALSSTTENDWASATGGSGTLVTEMAMDCTKLRAVAPLSVARTLITYELTTS